MDQKDFKIKLWHYLSEIHYLMILNFHSSQNDIIEEQYGAVETFEPPTLYDEPDLGAHCMKNRDILECERTLKCITKKINFVVYFTNMSTEQVVDIRKQIETQLMRTLSGFFPSFKFRYPPKVYGSFDNGLCSDIDNINVHVEYENIDVKEMWRQVYDRLEFNKLFTRIKLDLKSLEPLLILQHKNTNKEIVISFTNRIRLRNATLMKIFLDINPNLKPVIIYLKHILRLNNLFGEHKITSNHLFWLTTFLFQRKGLLPAVKVVREMNAEVKSYFNDTWDYNVPHLGPTNVSGEKPTEQSPASLFLSFVGFYSNFDFLRYVISPYIGHAIPIHQFDSYWVTTTHGDDTKEQPSLFQKSLFVKGAINFQDPIILLCNSFNFISIEVVNSFKLVCRYFYLHYYYTIYKGYNEDANFRIKFPANIPITLIQTTSFTLSAARLPPSYTLLRCVVITVRLIMENCLKFTKVKLIKNVEAKFGSWINVVYFNYKSNTDKSNLFTKLLLSRKIQSYVPGSPANLTPECFGSDRLKISIVCEIYDRNNIIFLLEGTGRLIEFFSLHGQHLFQYVMTHMVL